MSGDPRGLAALVALITSGLVLLLTLLASRRRNSAALVLLLLLFLGGLPQVARQLIATGVGGKSPLTLIGLAGQIMAFAFGVSGPSRRWFSGHRLADSSVGPLRSSLP